MHANAALTAHSCMHAACKPHTRPRASSKALTAAVHAVHRGPLTQLKATRQLVMQHVGCCACSGQVTHGAHGWMTTTTHAGVQRTCSDEHSTAVSSDRSMSLSSVEGSLKCMSSSSWSMPWTFCTRTLGASATCRRLVGLGGCAHSPHTPQRLVVVRPSSGGTQRRETGNPFHTSARSASSYALHGASRSMWPGTRRHAWHGSRQAAVTAVRGMPARTALRHCAHATHHVRQVLTALLLQLGDVHDAISAGCQLILVLQVLTADVVVSVRNLLLLAPRHADELLAIALRKKFSRGGLGARRWLRSRGRL